MDESHKYVEVNDTITFIGYSVLEKLFRVDLKGIGFEIGKTRKVNDNKWVIEIVREDNEREN